MSSGTAIDNYGHTMLIATFAHPSSCGSGTSRTAASSLGGIGNTRVVALQPAAFHKHRYSTRDLKRLGGKKINRHLQQWCKPMSARLPSVYNAFDVWSMAFM